MEKMRPSKRRINPPPPRENLPQDFEPELPQEESHEKKVKRRARVERPTKTKKRLRRKKAAPKTRSPALTQGAPVAEIPQRTGPQTTAMQPGSAAAPAPRPTQVRRYRVARHEMRRRRRKRMLTLTMILAVVVLIGAVLSINVLFKVQSFRVENLDKSVPADTGVYTEQEILDALGVQTGDNMFGFSIEKTVTAMCAALPYLDQVEIHRSLPGTVVVRVQAAEERYSLRTEQGWVTLSANFRILSKEQSRRRELIYLRLPDVLAGEVGQTIEFAPKEEETAAQSSASQDSSSSQAQSASQPEVEVEEETPLQTLEELCMLLEQEGLMDKITQIDLTDETEITVTYDDRVVTELGTANHLEYKLQMAGYILRNDNGDALSDTDEGTLDVSHLKSDGTIQAVFSPKQ